MSTRCSRENIGALLGLAAMATTTRSKMLAARRTRSWWPLVIGSKVPGYRAVLLFMVNPDVCARQMIPHLARGLRFDEFPPGRNRRRSGRARALEVHPAAAGGP